MTALGSEWGWAGTHSHLHRIRPHHKASNLYAPLPSALSSSLNPQPTCPQHQPCRRPTSLGPGLTSALTPSSEWVSLEGGEGCPPHSPTPVFSHLSKAGQAEDIRNTGSQGPQVGLALRDQPLTPQLWPLSLTEGESPPPTF